MGASQEQSRKVAIALEDVSVLYRQNGSSILAVEHVTFSVYESERLCILGPSGCGKSTILHLLGGFIKPTSGVVQVRGRANPEPGADRGVVFQRYSLLPWRTVYENVALGPRMRGASVAEQDRIVKRFLGLVGLAEFADSFPGQLSAGMQQRAAVARAYANDPDMLLLDEPFASLDAQNAVLMRELLLSIWSEHPKTVLLVTHDVDEALLLADRVVILSDRPGRVIKERAVDLPRPRTRDLYSDPRYGKLRAELLGLVLRPTSGMMKADVAPPM